MASRQRRSYFLRGGYVVALALYVLLVWTEVAPSGAAAASVISRMADAGRHLVWSILLFQFIALQVVAVVLLSGSFSREADKRTLASLLASPITERQMVVGKLAGGVLQAAMLLLCGVPILAVARVFGGVPWQQVAAGSAVTLGSLVLAGSVAVYLSTVIRQPLAVMGLSVLAMLVYNAVPWVLVSVLLHWLALDWLNRRLGRDRTSWSAMTALLQALVSVLLVLSFLPMLAGAVYLTAVASDYASPAATIGWSGGGGMAAGAMVLLLQAVIASLVLRKAGASVAKGRGGEMFERQGLDPAQADELARAVLGAAVVDGPAARAAEDGEAEGKASSRRRGWRRRREGAERLGSPVVWKDTLGPLLRSESLHIFLIVLPLTVGLGLYAGALLEGRFAERAGHFWGLVTPALAAGMLLTALLAATSISGERQARMWPALLTSGLSDWQILWGKSVAVFWRVRYLWLVLVLHLLAFVIAGVLHPLTPVLVAMVVLGCHVFLTGLGAYVGTRTTQNSVALLVVLGVAGGLWLVLPAVVQPLWPAVAGEPLHPSLYFLHPLSQAQIATEGYWPYYHRTRYLGVADLGEDWAMSARLTLQFLLLYGGAGGLLGWRAARRFRACAF